MSIIPSVAKSVSQPVCVQRISTIKMSRLTPIGTSEPPRHADNPYPSGQLFTHKVLDYRGVILFPWITRVYDRDNEKEKSRVNSLTAQKAYSSKPVIQYYYQTLVDERDWKTVRLQVDSLAFIGVQNSRGQFYRESFEGFDYVSHDDIQPYTSSESIPFQHDMFDTFLTRRIKDSNNCFVPKDVLRVWQKGHVFYLNLSNVYRETTKNIRVSVIPFYLGSIPKQDENAYWWRYCVRVETFSNESCTLKEREWKIKSCTGVVETKKARGVLLREPELSKNQRAFQFSSCVKLLEPSGTMWGLFKMEKESGTYFRVNVPPCYLKSEQVDDIDPDEPNLKS